jgi:putative nucleotidyltransferase with HDIG domain
MPGTDGSQQYVNNLEALVGARNEQLRQSMSQLEAAHECVLEAYGDALSLKHRATAEHSKRVTGFSIALCREMGLNALQIREVARAAFLHDIGKLAVPDSILIKSAPLTESEVAIMQQHCAKGYELVHKVPFLTEVAKVIHAHHERWDGNGYPQGLKGDAIPFGARIVAVVDAFDRIMHDQAQRPARSLDDAVREITGGSGTQFDPQVVRAFLSVPQSTWLDIAKDVEKSAGNFA